MSATRPFSLPSEPIDRYRVEWWDVTSYCEENVNIRHCEAFYYVNAKWAEIVPEDPDRGVDFVNHWRVLYDGEFRARTCDGWSEAFDNYQWQDSFATRAEAVRHAVYVMRQRVASLLKRSDACKLSAERLENEARDLETGRA